MLIQNFLCIILHCHVSFHSYSQLAFCVHYIFNSVLCSLNWRWQKILLKHVFKKRCAVSQNFNRVSHFNIFFMMIFVQVCYIKIGEYMCLPRQSWGNYSWMFTEPEVNKCFSVIFRVEYQELQNNGLKQARNCRHKIFFLHTHNMQS